MNILYSHTFTYSHIFTHIYIHSFTFIHIHTYSHIHSHIFTHSFTSHLSHHLSHHLSLILLNRIETRVFGADLLGVMKRQRERRPNAKLSIPVCIDMCFKFLRDRYLDELGLFRLSGSLRQINNLIKKFNCEMEEQFSDSLDPHVVTGLVKRYLRDLQNPLLTFDAYSHIKSLFSSEMSEYPCSLNHHHPPSVTLHPISNTNTHTHFHTLICDTVTQHTHSFVTL